MKLHKYRKNIFDFVLSSNCKILLPEDNNRKICDSINEMKKIGFNICNIDEFGKDTTYYRDYIYNKKFTINWTEKMLDQYINNSLNQGLILLDDNKVDCLVAGVSISTAEVIRSSIRIIGVSKKWVSSVFLMISPDGNTAFTYSDCGVIPEPDENQLVSIAHSAANSHKLLTNQEPIVAFLSFSTKGSAEHYKVKRIQKAVKLFSKKYPNILNDGEIQFDAAINYKIAKEKDPDSIIKGNANVFIFPDLGAANIAYKITQYLAGYDAWGPLLRGLNKPVHDLSRGASVNDIISIAAIAGMESLKQTDL